MLFVRPQRHLELSLALLECLADAHPRSSRRARTYNDLFTNAKVALAAHHVTCAERTSSFGNVEDILAALSKQSSHVDVQTSCLDALGQLAANGSCGVRRLAAGVCDDGIDKLETGVDSIVGRCGVGVVGVEESFLPCGRPRERLSCTPQPGTLAVNGFVFRGVEVVALKPACEGGVATMTDENKVLIVSLGGVELVLSALRTHSSHAGIQASGLAALAELALNNGSCES